MELHLQSSLAMPWPSCKLKTKKGNYMLKITALHQLLCISLFITTYVACYTAPRRTALLEYLELLNSYK